MFYELNLRGALIVSRFSNLPNITIFVVVVVVVVFFSFLQITHNPLRTAY